MPGFADAFAALQERTDNFEELRQGLSKEVIEEAIALRGQAKVRHRKLPPETVLWLVIGLGLFRNKSLFAVAETLNLWVDGRPAASSLCVSRKRLGPEPLRYLFRRLGEVWSAEAADETWNGLHVFAVDGTQMNVSDTEENEAYFGRPGSPGDTTAAYPQARIVTRMNVLSRYIIDAEDTPLSQHESVGAKAIFGRTEGNSLTILDRGFQGFRSFCNVYRADENRHFLARVKSTFKYKFIRQLEGSSFLAEIVASSAEDKKDESLPDKLVVRVIDCLVEGNKKPMRLVTTLLEQIAFPALEIAQMYHLRWEIELGFKEIKTTLLERREALRSQSPAGVQQEIAGIFVAYNLIRREMYMVAKQHNVSASRISFTAALQMVHTFFHWSSLQAAAPGNFPKDLSRAREQLWDLRLPPRRSSRASPRWVKRKMSNFPKKPSRVALKAKEP
ncbi:hypothetical protein Q3G72_016321 [Acer saccharum]|nr:hypothetical protein Q3G72_016321 [Acer saccharum]